MHSNSLIEEKLFVYEDFLRYCKESGKRFVNELDREDFIAYRAEYSVPREQVEQIKALLNFQEQKSSEEILPPQNNFDGQEDSLQKYLKIDALSPYENVLISEMDFNARVQNCLSSNGYRTLAELLKSSQQELSSLRNFGKGSFDNLISTLKNFFALQRKEITTETLRLANEELDEFLRNAALNHAPQVDFIISAFEKFSDLVTIKSAFRNLPEEFRDKRVRSFFLACGLKKNNFFVDLPDDLTLAELPEYFAENAIDFDIDELKNFISALRFDVRACAKKIFYFLHALTDGKSLLTLDDAKNFLDATDAEMLWFFVAKTNLSSSVFHFDEELNAIIFADENRLDENDLIKNLPDIMDEEIFEKTITNLAREKNVPLN